MLFCPLMFYGNAREHDMDWGQFSIMFRSISWKGLAGRTAGVRLILKHLVRKFRALGGELQLRGGVKRMAVEERPRDAASCSKMAKRLEARNVALVGRLVRNDAAVRRRPAGRHVARRRPADVLRNDLHARRASRSDLGHDRTIMFFNDSEKFHWQKPDELCDVRSGVICSPNNFAYDCAAGRRHDADHGAGELRPLAGARRRRLPAGKAPLVRPDDRSRPCGSCPTSAAA